MFERLMLLALAGAAGTLARYGVAGVAQRMAGAGFPWGTVAVNAIGCCAAGLVWTVLESRLGSGSQTRVVIMVGFMGAFTTFSTFILETGELARDAEWAAAIGNIALQNCLGLALFFVGVAIGRHI